MKKFNLSKGLIVGLLTFALSIVAFAAVGASADAAAEATPTKSVAVPAEYNAAYDTVTAGSNAYVYVVKAASGNKIKAGTAAAGQMEANKIKIADLGIKGTKKDVFLYVCDKEVEVEETVAANLTIKGNANKVVGVIDYTQADVPGSAKVLSAYYVDKSTKKQVAIASDKLKWSPDGEAWYDANSLTESTRKDSKGQGTADGFLGNDLAEMLEAGGLIYVKQVGTDGGATAQFGSAIAKVKIAKQAKAPKVKIDVAKDTIGLKNGFDFALVMKNGTTNEYTDIVKWYTILPALKTATISTEGDSIVGGTHGEKATAYKPLGKKDANAGKEVKNDGDDNYYYSYTKYAFKTLSIDKLFEVVDLEPEQAGIQLLEGCKIAVRKSATEKKPASAYTVIDLALKTEAPVVFTQDKVNDQFLVASADEFSKKGLTLGEIAPFAGYTGTGNSTKIATDGFWNTFKIAEASDSIKDRDEGSTFEYTVVSTADYYATGDAAIDWTTVKWKKFDPAKLKITEKLSGKYSTVKGTKKTADLKGTASSEIKQTGETEIKENYYGNQAIKADAIKAGTKSLLLVRRQGDKSTGKRASKEVVLYVAKEGKKYNLYSTVSVGQAANKYRVVFGKYKAAEGTNAAGFYIDDSIAEIAGYTQKKKTGIKLEAPTDAEYWLANPVDGKPMMTLGGSKLTAVAQAIATGTDADTDAVAAGDYQITFAWDNNSSGNSATYPIAIREYANITVKGTAAVKGTTDTALANSDMELAKVVKGKVQVWNGTSKKFEAPTGNADVVTAYVGTALDLTLNAPAYAYPTGYEADQTNKYKVVEGQTYNYNDKKLTVTAASAEEVEETVTYYAKLRKVTVHFASDGGSNVADAQVDYGTTVTKPTDPTKDNNTFGGWFTDAQCTKAFDFSTKIEEEITLYAKWTAVQGS